MGDAGEAENDTHSVKKLDLDELKQFRDRFNLPLTDSELESVPYYRPPKDSPELAYLQRNRERLGGSIPRRIVTDETLVTPELPAFKNQLTGTGERTNSTTMGFVRMLATLLRDKNIGERVVPIVPDEARTFGMEGLFRQLVFTPLKVSYTSQKILVKSPPTAKPKTVKYWKRVLTKPAPCQLGLPQPPVIPITARPWCRSIYTIRCLAFNA